MMGDNGPSNQNSTFIYDTAVYYDESDQRREDIQKYRDKLEHNKWGFSVCDPYRDGHGERMKRFKQSFIDSRHAIVFLSPDVLERMNKNLEDAVEFKMGTFLSGILESHDLKLKRRLIPIVFESDDRNFQKPFLLSDFSILCPGKKGFYRHLYRSLSKLSGPDTITQRQIRQKVDAMGRDRYTDRVVTGVAHGLEIPEEVLEDILQEYGGHKAMLIETVECWRLRHGPDATATILDRVLERCTTTPQQVADLPPQSLVRTHITEEPSSMIPIQRQTTTSEVQGAAHELDAALNIDVENLTVHSGEAQLHGLEVSSESEPANDAAEAPGTDGEEQTEGAQPPPEPEPADDTAEAPGTDGEQQTGATEGSQPPPEPELANDTAEAPGTDGEQQTGATEGAQHSPEPG
ncbi:uncharacterized protein LOC118404879 [Branchiostoma floridae]|uniref:Uncharacterized protein LOC118404879 n=1 Tax=Branchiostoma floridae TaxID=7739 RepID=A0A9J7HIQ5_BRAFL|nr:uncharacterized protein LOC118404879 [Branchiostoma floridae]